MAIAVFSGLLKFKVPHSSIQVSVSKSDYTKYGNMLMERLGLNRFIMCEDGDLVAWLVECYGVMKEWRTC